MCVCGGQPIGGLWARNLNSVHHIPPRQSDLSLVVELTWGFLVGAEWHQLCVIAHAERTAAFKVAFAKAKVKWKHVLWSQQPSLWLSVLPFMHQAQPPVARTKSPYRSIYAHLLSISFCLRFVCGFFSQLLFLLHEKALKNLAPWASWFIQEADWKDTAEICITFFFFSILLV